MKKIVTLVFLILVALKSPCLVYGEEISTPKGNVSPIVQEENKKEESKIEKETKVNKEEIIAKDEIYKALLESKNEKIGLLQGNISNLIAFFSAVIAFIALLAAVFGVVLNNSFTKRYEEAKGFKEDVEEKVKEVEKKIDEINTLEGKVLEIREALVENQKVLRKKEEDFVSHLNWIESTSHFLNYLEMKDAITMNYIKFLYFKPSVAPIISNIEDIIQLDFTKYEKDFIEKRQTVTETAGGDETIYATKAEFVEEYNYLINCMKREEDAILNSIESEIEFTDVLEFEGEKLEFIGNDEVESSYQEWNSYYQGLLKLHNQLKGAKEIIVKPE
ncbi:hypothetical protein OB994_00110 [Bacillus cereus]|nr:hypothetical protein [Bacillus cereus]